MLIILAAACEALFNVFSKAFFRSVEHMQKEPMDPAVQTILVSFMAMVLCMLSAVGETPLARLAVLPLSGWLSLFWYGIFVTALSYICWYAGIARCGALTAAAFSGMMPFTSAMLSILVLKETLAPLQLLGGLCIMGGMVWLGMSASREGRTSTEA
jgi:drug/metabolite transporter (DMT)-like permease